MQGRLQISATGEDLEAYVREQIRRSSLPVRHVFSRVELGKPIISIIISEVRGMILIAQLHIEILACKISVKAVRKALRDLPEELEGLYTNALERVRQQPEDFRHLGESVLMFLTCAREPLSLQMLQNALAVEPNESNLDLANIPGEDRILNTCVGLVIVEC